MFLQGKRVPVCFDLLAIPINFFMFVLISETELQQSKTLCLAFRPSAITDQDSVEHFLFKECGV